MKHSAVLFAMALSAYTATTNAATCAAGTGTACPANTLCVDIGHATTDTDGAPMVMIGTELTIGTLPTMLIPTVQTQYNHAVAKNTTLAAGTIIKGATLAANDKRSTDYTCALATAVSGPQSLPAAPKSLRAAGI